MQHNTLSVCNAIEVGDFDYALKSKLNDSVSNNKPNKIETTNLNTSIILTDDKIQLSTSERENQKKSKQEKMFGPSLSETCDEPTVKSNEKLQKTSEQFQKELTDDLQKINRLQVEMYFLRRYVLAITFLMSIVLGVILYSCLRGTKTCMDREIIYSFPEHILLNLLNMIVLPLLVFSLVSSLGSVDMNTSSKIGKKEILYYVVTTITAVLLGFILEIIIRPGFTETNTFS